MHDDAGVAFTAAMVTPYQSFGQQFAYEKIFGDEDSFASGILNIQVGGEKPAKPTKDNTYVSVLQILSGFFCPWFMLDINATHDINIWISHTFYRLSIVWRVLCEFRFISIALSSPLVGCSWFLEVSLGFKHVLSASSLPNYFPTTHI